MFEESKYAMKTMKLYGLNTISWLQSQECRTVPQSVRRDMEDVYVALQIQIGDKYTAPRVFHLADSHKFLSAHRHVQASCDCGVVYSDDSGYTWCDELSSSISELPLSWAADVDCSLVCEECELKIEYNLLPR